MTGKALEEKLSGPFEDWQTRRPEWQTRLADQISLINKANCDMFFSFRVSLLLPVGICTVLPIQPSQSHQHEVREIGMGVCGLAVPVRRGFDEMLMASPSFLDLVLI